MSMTKYECSVDYFQGQIDLSLQGMSTLEALIAGGEAIELLSELAYGQSVNEAYLYERIYKLLKEWD